MCVVSYRSVILEESFKAPDAGIYIALNRAELWDTTAHPYNVSITGGELWSNNQEAKWKLNTYQEE